MKTATSSRMSWSRDRRWVVWLIITVIGLWCTSSGSEKFTAGMLPDGSRGPTGPAFAVVGGLLLTLVGTVMTARGLWWRFRGWPRKARTAELALAGAQHQWNNARTLYRVLSAGKPLTPLNPGPIILRPGEQAHLSLPVGFARHVAAGDGSYTRVTAFGTGAVGVGLVAGSLIGNSRRRAAARASAAPAWRCHQQTQVLVTDQRMICNASSRQLYFDWAAVTAFYPRPADGTVVFEFADVEPLMLHGPAAAMLAVYATWKLRPHHGFVTSPPLAILR